MKIVWDRAVSNNPTPKDVALNRPNSACVYWDVAWVPEEVKVKRGNRIKVLLDLGFVGKVDGQYWLLSPNWVDINTDIGPFRTLKDAKTALLTMIRLGHFPEGWE